MKKKKEKNPYPRSFASRLTWRIMLTLLIVMGITSYFIFVTTWSVVVAESEAYCMEMLKSRNEKIRRLLSDVYVASVNTLPDIEKNLNQPDQLYALMERLVSLNPHIHSSGISFVENYYPQKGRWFCPYAIRNDSNKIETMTLGDEKFDYLNKKWFVEACAAKKGFWGKPFFDTNDSTLLTSYMIPIRDKQDRTVAVLGVDLSLEWLTSKLQHNISVDIGNNRKAQLTTEDDDTIPVDRDNEENKGRKSYFIVIDSDGTYIAHPDKEKILNANFFEMAKETPDTLDNYIVKMMKSGYNGFYHKDEDGNELVIDGEESYVFYSPIKKVNWSMAFVVPGFYVKILAYVIIFILVVLILLALLVVFIVGRIAIRRAVKPVWQLASSANEVAQGHFDTPLPQVKRHDEICMLRDSFDEMQHSLTKYVEELKTTTAQKSAIENELKIAHSIQMAMLPKTFPPYPERKDVDIYGFLTPAKGVGGDLFDFYIRDEKLIFCIGDVSGKGIPAALVMAMTRSLFRNISLYTLEPGKIVYALNNALSDSNDTNMFVTVFVGVLNLKTGTLQYCNAGHESPLLVGRDVGVLPCDANLPIGVVFDFKYTQQETVIDSQTTIFLYTDGINEAENSVHDQFGYQRIMDVASRSLSEQQHQPERLIHEMNDAVRAFVGDAEQSDDLTMLAVQYTV